VHEKHQLLSRSSSAGPRARHSARLPKECSWLALALALEELALALGTTVALVARVLLLPATIAIAMAGYLHRA